MLKVSQPFINEDWIADEFLNEGATNVEISSFTKEEGRRGEGGREGGRGGGRGGRREGGREGEREGGREV